MKESNNGYKKWLQDNLWNLLITAVGIIISMAYLQARVAAVELKAQQTAEKVATYPSQDYFDLRFNQIEKTLNEVRLKVDNYLQQ